MRTIYLITAFLLAGLIQAQNYKFGKISKEELEKKQSSLDPEAAAEILYETSQVSIEYSTSEKRFLATKEVEGRIKIYDKDRLDKDHLIQQISLYIGSSPKEKAVTFRGSTASLENGKVVNYKVGSQDIFIEHKNKYWDTQKMTFPNVSNGSVIEYKYTVVTPRINDLGRWFFQSDIPVLHSSYTMIAPEFFIFSQDERGGIKGKIQTKSMLVPDVKYKNIRTDYTFENVPALGEEPYVFNPNNMRASLRYELMKFEYPGYITENYSTTWKQIGQDLMFSSDFGDQIRGNGFLDDTVQGLVGGVDSQIDKTQAVFNFVRNNYSWNRFNSIYTENGVRQTFKSKTGNVADINLMLVSMLQKAGLDAAPVVLSTVNNLLINYSFPSKTSLNYVIASVVINNKLYLMDATEKLSDINMLPYRALNQRGFRIANGDVEEVPLNNYSMSNSKVTINAALSPNGVLNGNFAETRDAYFAMTDKINQVDDPKEFEKNYLKKFSFDIDNFKIDENLEKGIMRYSFKFEDLKIGELVGGKIIINPMLFSQLKKSSFTQTSRNYPLEFGSLLSQTKIIKIKIPEGYKLEKTPDSKQHILQGEAAGYSYQVEEQNGYIVVATIFQIGHPALPPAYYQPMKELENQQIAAEAQQVILVKN